MHGLASRLSPNGYFVRMFSKFAVFHTLATFTLRLTSYLKTCAMADDGLMRQLRRQVTSPTVGTVTPAGSATQARLCSRWSLDYLYRDRISMLGRSSIGLAACCLLLLGKPPPASSGSPAFASPCLAILRTACMSVCPLLAGIYALHACAGMHRHWHDHIHAQTSCIQQLSVLIDISRHQRRCWSVCTLCCLERATS